MSIEALGDFCDWFDLDSLDDESTLHGNADNQGTVMWGGRMVTYDPIVDDSRAKCMLAMSTLKAPDEAVVSGGYSQEKGAYLEAKLQWNNKSQDNSSSEKELPSKSNEPVAKESTSKTKESPAKESSPKKNSKW